MVPGTLPVWRGETHSTTAPAAQRQPGQEQQARLPLPIPGQQQTATVDRHHKDHWGRGKGAASRQGLRRSHKTTETDWCNCRLGRVAPPRTELCTGRLSSALLDLHFHDQYTSRGRLSHSSHTEKPYITPRSSCFHRVPSSQIIPWSRPTDHVVRVLRGRGLVPLWVHKSALPLADPSLSLDFGMGPGHLFGCGSPQGARRSGSTAAESSTLA